MHPVGVNFGMFQAFPGATPVQLDRKSLQISAFQTKNRLGLPSKWGSVGVEKCWRLTSSQGNSDSV